MSLRETLVDAAEAKASAAAAAVIVPTLQGRPDLSERAVEGMALFEEETSCATSPVAEPELAEALARSKALEFTALELASLKALTGVGLQRELANAKGKEFISAAKLVVLMQKIERESYLELRKQSLDSQPKRRRVIAFPSSYLAEVSASMGEGLRNVTPAKETRDA